MEQNHPLHVQSISLFAHEFFLFVLLGNSQLITFNILKSS